MSVVLIEYSGHLHADYELITEVQGIATYLMGNATFTINAYQMS